MSKRDQSKTVAYRAADDEQLEVKTRSEVKELRRRLHELQVEKTANDQLRSAQGEQIEALAKENKKLKQEGADVKLECQSLKQ